MLTIHYTCVGTASFNFSFLIQFLYREGKKKGREEVSQNFCPSPTIAHAVSIFVEKEKKEGRREGKFVYKVMF